MDELCQKQLQKNARRFQWSLERIIDKYSKLQYQDGGIEVDLDNTHSETLGHYMTLSKKNLNKLESKSCADLREESLQSQDITSYTQLDESGALDSPDSSCLAEDDVTCNDDITHLNVSSGDESQRTFTETNNQPEEQDEQLEMSLQSQGSSLGDLYPNMISQIGKAWRRQHVSEAADSVLRRYRRWRRLANRTNPTSSFNSALRHTAGKKKSREILIEDVVKSPVKSLAVPLTEAAPYCPVHACKTHQQCSPVRARGPQRREPHPTAVVMDLSSVSQPDEILLNKTFTVSVLASPQRSKHPSMYTVSPSRHWYLSPRMSQDHSFRIKESSPHRMQGAGCSVSALEYTTLTERPDIYGSPLRQSPYKAPFTSLGGSPRAFVASPKSPYVQSYYRELKRPRSVSTSLSSPPPKMRFPQRTLDYHDSRPSFQEQQSSPRSAPAGSRHGLRRHLSFDSSLPSNRASYSAKDLDDDFVKVYHKFVCLNKSTFLNGPPCRVCAKTSEASRGQSFSNLAALALSPHRSVLRKRHRDLVWDSYPQSKRFRDSYW